MIQVPIARSLQIKIQQREPAQGGRDHNYCLFNISINRLEEGLTHMKDGIELFQANKMS